MKRINVFLAVAVLALLAPGFAVAGCTGGNSGDNACNETNPTATGGSATAKVDAAQTVAPLPNIVSPSISAPQIFGPLGNTPGSASVSFIAAANKLCGVRYTRNFLPSAVPFEDTESKQTRIIFSAYASLLMKERSDVLVEEIIPPYLAPGVFANSVCLGTLTVMTKEKSGSKTDFAVVQSDAMRFLFDRVRGYRKIALVSLITSVSAASGVSSDATSFGIGGALGHLLSSVTTLGLTPGFTSGSGNSNPTNFPGGTFLVLAVREEGGQSIDTGELAQFFPPQQRRQAEGLPPAVKNEALK